MGKIISVSSEVKKSGKSVVTYMLTNHIREVSRRDLKILVCCLNFKYSSLYKLLGIDISATGLEDLVNYQFLESSNPELLMDIIPENGGIYFLGSYRTTDSYVRKNMDKYGRLFDELQKCFDLIIVDTVSGKDNALTNIVIQKSHVVIKLLVQDNESISGLGCVKDEQVPYNQEIIHVIAKYRNIYPKTSDFKRRYSLKRIYTMEYCETLQEMKNRDSLHLYLQRETDCNDSIRKVSRHIAETLGFLPEGIREKQTAYMRSLIMAFKRTDRSEYT